MPSGIASGVNPKRAGKSSSVVKFFTAPIGASNFVASVTGLHKVYVLGAGAGGNLDTGGGTPNSGGGGAYCEVEVLLQVGQVVALYRGQGGARRNNSTGSGQAGEASTVTLPGRTISAGGGTPSLGGGVATGGDININGVGSAPGNQGKTDLPFPSDAASQSPGLGAGGSSSVQSASYPGASGAITIVWQE